MPRPKAKISLVYVTVPNMRAARKIAKALVEEGLVACANILPKMTAIYRWNDALQEGRETALLLKTGSDRVKKVVERVRALHLYQCPCVVALPIHTGHDAFLTWVWRQSRPPKAKR